MEEQFYIVWPLVILFAPTKALKKLFIGGVLAGLFFRILIFLLVRYDMLPFFQKSAPTVIYFFPFSHLDAFSFGAYISRFPIFMAQKKFRFLCLTLPAIALLTSFAHVGNFGFVPALGFGFMLPAAYQFIWGYTLLNYFFALLVRIVAFDNCFARVLESPSLRYIGRISYGFYVFHFPVIWFVDQASSGFGLLGGWGPLFVAMLSFNGTLLLATLSFFALETPFLKLKDRLVAY